MAKKRKVTARGIEEEVEEDEEEVVAEPRKAQAAAESGEPKSEGDLTQEEIDEQIVKQVKEAVVCVTSSDPVVKLTPEQATRLLTLAVHPLGEE